MTTATAMKVPYSYLDREFAEPDAILEDIRRLVMTGDFTLGYPVRAFEDAFSAFTGLRYCVGAASGTDALMMALRMLGVGPGDSVIVPANTFVATAGAVAMVGAEPIFADVTDDYCLDPDDLERRARPNTKAVIPVHLTGTVADMPRIVAVARAHGWVVVEDAAQALGATLDGAHVGMWGDAAEFSLHPLKMLNVWGDGGMVTAHTPEADRRLRLLRNHGLESRDDAVLFGYNGRLSSLQAAVALRVIEGTPRAILRRRQLAERLTTELVTLGGAVLPPVTRPGVQPVWMTYIVRVPGGRRDALRAHLLDRGVDVKVHYPAPLHLQTVGREMGHRPGDIPNAERQANEILTLPLHEYLTDNEAWYMLAQIRAFFGGRA